jgi:hypothetical protein
LIKTRQNIYNSTNDIFKDFHEIRKSIELTLNDEKISFFIRTFAFSLFHQFSKKEHLAHSRDATNIIILSKNHNDHDLRENLSWDEIKRRINLHWLIIDNQSINSRLFYNHANNIETFAMITHRVTVGLSWTRARASNSRVGQDWTYLICPGGLNGFEFLSDELNRTSTFDRAGWSGSSSCPTGWIEQAYLSVERPTRISAHTKSSNWETNPRVDHQILPDELNWTNNSVRRVELNKQSCPSPSSGLARVSWP